jgi:hypothetical protein
MTDIQSISDWIANDSTRFEKRKKMLVFSSVFYRPTNEKLTEGFRYYACGIEELLAVFDAGDIEELTKLPYALDEDGDRDTSGVLVDLAYTPSVSIAAIQPVQYIDHNPTPMRPPLVLEGERAQAVKAAVLELGE